MTDTPQHYVPHVPESAGRREPTSWLPGATEPQSQPRTAPWLAPSTQFQPRARARGTNGRTVLVGLVAGFAGLLVGAAGTAAAFVLPRDGKNPISSVVTGSQEPFTLAGSLALTRGYDGSTACGGSGGFADIVTSAPITVTDAAGATIALGRLDPGVVRTGGCIFEFRIEKVPGDKDFYGVEVTHRGVLKYTRAEAMSGQIRLTIG